MLALASYRTYLWNRRHPGAGKWDVKPSVSEEFHKSVKTFRDKNDRALVQLRTWLHAVNIDYVPGAAGNDITVKRADQTMVDLLVTEGPTRMGAQRLIIAAGDITGRRIKSALRMFGQLQKKLGYIPRPPVDRGPLPTRHAHYRHDFDLVAMSHTEFRRVPNNQDILTKYSATMARACWKFLKHYYQLCGEHLLAFDDVRTYAAIWTTNFVGLHAVPDERNRYGTNDRLLMLYLRQRFQYFAGLLRKRSRDSQSDPGEHGFGEYSRMRGDLRGFLEDGPDQEYVDRHTIDDDETETPTAPHTDEGYIRRHRQLNTQTPACRRLSAIALLDRSLQALPHDGMIVALATAAENRYIHPDAQKLAGQRLQAHQAICSECRAATASAA